MCRWVQSAMTFLYPYCFGTNSVSELCCTADFTLNEILGAQKYSCAWKGSLRVSCPASGLDQDQLQSQMRFHSQQKRLVPVRGEDMGFTKAELSQT